MIENHQEWISTERVEEKVTVILEGEVVAETTSAIKLVEEGSGPVIFIPKNDIKEIDLIKTADYDSPTKGHAEVYTIRHGGRDIENGAWSYDEPTTHLQELMGRVAFYPDKVQEIRVGEA
jgi:uncharacterized protein (DUF427 family)